MIRSFHLASLAGVLSLAACMTPPSAEHMAGVPVVRYGTPAPADKNFVLHYPAGSALPVVASVSGSLIDKPTSSRLEIAVKRDVFVYGPWASFDGKTWRRGDDLVTSTFEVTLPGAEDGVRAGTMSSSFNLK